MAKPNWGLASRSATVGIEMVLSIMIGIITGLGIDGVFESKPFGFLGGLFMGIALAVKAILDLIKMVRKQEGSE